MQQPAKGFFKAQPSFIFTAYFTVWRQKMASSSKKIVVLRLLCLDLTCQCIIIIIELWESLIFTFFFSNVTFKASTDFIKCYIDSFGDI